MIKNDDIEELNISEALGAEHGPSSQILALYIPNKDKEGEEIEHHEMWVKRGLKVLSIIGGGATAIPPADGTWLDPDKREKILDPAQLKDEDLVWEKTTFMYTYIDADRFLENAEHLRRFLHDFGRETKQGEVVFEFDEEFFRIQKYDPVTI